MKDSPKEDLKYKIESYADNSKYEGFILSNEKHLLGTR
jgi:hypothetical protein